MQREEQIFLSNEPLSATGTSITLDIVSSEDTLGNEPLSQKKILEGRITLDPQKARIYALSHLKDAQILQSTNGTPYDFYLAMLPFTLHSAIGDNYYQKVTLFIKLTTPDVSAFDLFPRKIISPINHTTYYTVTPDMQIREIEANAQPDSIRIHFEALQPLITAFGEGEQRFYWTYKGDQPQKEVRPETKHALMILQVPHNTLMIEGTVSYEIMVVHSLFDQEHTIQSEVDPYPIHWQLDAAMLLSPPARQHAPTQKTRAINLFYMYASRDESLHTELERQLAVLRMQGWIKEWRTLDIKAGRPQTEVNDSIEHSQIILLLISPALLASEDLYKNQIELALRLQEQERARLIPILLRPTSGWQETQLGQFIVLPRNNKPVSTWRYRDQAFVEIADEIREIIKHNFGS